MQRVDFEARGHVAWIHLARPEKRNAFDWAMFEQLQDAYQRYEDDPSLRCAVLAARGEHFTGGLQLDVVGPELSKGRVMFDPNKIDPLRLAGPGTKKPVLAALKGYCLTIGIELALACDVVVAHPGTKLSQIEVQRGIYPFGGATVRMPRTAGWGNAMRWLLTGDFFDAEEARRIGIVQEIADDPDAAAGAIAERIAAQAPLGVQAVLASARNAVAHGEAAEYKELVGRAKALFASDDADEGVRSFVERRAAAFEGR